MAAVDNAWRAFRNWRRSRPFGAGACTLLAGLAVLFPPFASMKLGDAVITLNTVGGISASVIGVVLLVCAGAFLARPQFRLAAGIVTLLLSLAAISAANLGTFLIATMLGITGAALGISWSPTSRAQAAEQRRRGRAGERADAAGSSAEERTDAAGSEQVSVRAGGGES